VPIHRSAPIDITFGAKGDGDVPRLSASHEIECGVDMNHGGATNGAGRFRQSTIAQHVEEVLD
jgi:hypothetical protein